jgi:GT2 family glycosyltransferase
MSIALSVIIPTLGDHPLLRRVLDGYERQQAPAGTFEVIVVADAAETDVGAVEAAIARRAYPVRLMRGGTRSASANRNAGWRAATGPIVLFCDNDTVPTPRLVAEHLNTHARLTQTEVAVVGCVRWARGIEVTPFMRWLDRGIQFDYGSIRGEDASWAHLYTANASIKREMLERVGGFDEERLPYGYEDLDWGYRAREHGLRVVYNRRAIVDHWQTMDIEMWKRRVARLARSEHTFCRLHPEVAPFFHQRFSEAVRTPPGRGLGTRLARHVPRWLPWLGPAVWRRAELHWLQELAPHFMAAWEAAEESDGGASA